MAQFKDLPIEVIIMIIECVLPGDIVNFSATSNNIQRLSEPCLQKHYEMKRRYKIYSCTQTSSPVSNLLYDIISQPSAALYVECLTIKTWYDCWDDDKPEPSHTGYPQEKMMSLKKAVADCVPSSYEVSRMTAAIERGSEDPLIAILLLQVPNVTTLKIKGFGDSSQYLFYTLPRMLEMPGAPHLSNLITLEINGHNSEPDTWCPN